MNLFDVDERLQGLEDAAVSGSYIDPDTGEITSYEEQFFRAAAQMAREEQIENLINTIKNLNIEIDARKSHKKKIEDQIKGKEFAVLRNKEILMSLLTNQDGTTEKYKTPMNSAYIKNNPPAVVISDEAMLPMEFKIQKIEVRPDKASIKEVLSRGIEVPGAHLERGRSVVIK